MKFGSFGAGEGEFNMPWGITVDDEGCVYVADWRNDRIQKFTADGVFIMRLGRSGCEDGQFNRPSGVAVDTDGDIYVSDRGNNRVQLFSAEGRFVEKFIGDATLGKQARSYMITNMVAMRLREMTSIEPQKRLRAPISVRVDGEGRMYVTDYGSHRVQVYQKEAIRLGEREIAAPLRSPTLYTQF
jgi:sugar lactone lactonase YvrE